MTNETERIDELQSNKKEFEKERKKVAARLNKKFKKLSSKVNKTTRKFKSDRDKSHKSSEDNLEALLAYGKDEEI